jgi:hypothetical protein
MGGYGDKQLFRMVFPEYDFGADADEVMSFRLPVRDDGTAMQGQLVNIGVMVTETFACTTTAASVSIGTAADADAYAKLNIADTTADLDFFDKSDDTDAIIADDIAAATLVQVTFTQGTDDSADAGKGYLVLDFYVW